MKQRSDAWFARQQAHCARALAEADKHHTPEEIAAAEAALVAPGKQECRTMPNEEAIRAGSRAEAIRAGSARYFDGRPCPSGHVAERYTMNGYCVDCQRDANRIDRQRVRQARAAKTGVDRA